MCHNGFDGPIRLHSDPQSKLLHQCSQFCVYFTSSVLYKDSRKSGNIVFTFSKDENKGEVPMYIINIINW